MYIYVYIYTYIFTNIYTYIFTNTFVHVSSKNPVIDFQGLLVVNNRLQYTLVYIPRYINSQSTSQDRVELSKELFLSETSNKHMRPICLRGLILKGSFATKTYMFKELTVLWFVSVLAVLIGDALC